MRVAILASKPGGPTHNVLSSLLPHLPPDVEATLFEPPFRPGDLNHFDVIHAGWQGLNLPLNELHPPLVCNVWHTRADEIGKTKALLNEYSQLVVDSPTTVATLGHMGYTNVHYAPLVMDNAKDMYPLPLPSTFTVGFLGADEPVRRWLRVREGAKLSGVDCYLTLFPQNREVQHLDLIEDFYRHISVYIHPGFLYTDPMTMHEAMLCGRPVISTRTSGPHEYIKEGWNGYFFNGGAEDLARKILLARENLDQLCVGATQTHFPSPADVVEVYVMAWREAVGEDE